MTTGIRLKVFIVLLLLCLGAGCDRPHPHPYQLDKIYGQLEREHSRAAEAVGMYRSQVAEHTESLRTARPQSGEARVAREQLEVAQGRLRRAEQMELFYRLRTESRKNEARRLYMAARAKGESWPSEEEQQAIATIQRLQSISLSWDDRVPRLHDRIPSSLAEPTE